MYNQCMIQDISPKIFKNEYRIASSRPEDYVFSFNGRSILCTLTGDAVSVPRIKDLEVDVNELVYLFEIDGEQFFLSMKELERYNSEEPNDAASENKFRYEDIKVLRSANPGFLCFAGMTAYHLYVWYRDNKYCGRCGNKTLFYDKERAVKCPNCGNIIYPKICPAVIVGVTHGSKIMMTRYAGRPYKGNALIAGFCEIGETAEDTVRREVYEEVGLKVKNIRYFASQPWGFDSNLLLGYFCELDGEADIKMDENELSRAEWVSRDDIGEEMSKLSLTATMMMYFKEHKEFFT